MNLLFIGFAYLCIGYLLGSLSFATIISRLLKLPDPRSYGSGNPGATNVLRSGNKIAALLTLILDALKAYLPILLAKHMGVDTLGFVALGLGAFIGHIWPIFYKFEGGKGVATAAGALLGFDTTLGGSCLVVWLMVALITRYSSLAALCAALSAPALTYWRFGSVTVTMTVTAMCAILLWRHVPNFRKLLAGKESKIGKSE